MESINKTNQLDSNEKKLDFGYTTTLVIYRFPGTLNIVS
jgi:hypothetical protein